MTDVENGTRLPYVKICTSSNKEWPGEFTMAEIEVLKKKLFDLMTEKKGTWLRYNEIKSSRKDWRRYLTKAKIERSLKERKDHIFHLISMTDVENGTQLTYTFPNKEWPVELVKDEIVLSLKEKSIYFT